MTEIDRDEESSHITSFSFLFNVTTEGADVPPWTFDIFQKYCSDDESTIIDGKLFFRNLLSCKF